MPFMPHASRTLDALGYVRFRHDRLYSESGLARRRVAVWLYGEQITVTFDETLLAQYAEVVQERLFA